MSGGRREHEAGVLAYAVARSVNAKIGESATTYAAQTSCPAACPFLDGGGCYAEQGPLRKFHTEPLNHAANSVDHEPIDVAQAEAIAIDALEVTPGRPLRLHTVGDCPDDASARIVANAAARYTADGGGPVWTYTHGWRNVERASWGAVSVLASCETADDVENARGRGYATAVVVERFAREKLYESGDTLLLPCPAQTRKRVTCANCRLCFDDAGIRARGYSIAFAVHGTPLAQRHALKALRDPDAPDRRLTSRTLIPRYLAEHPGATNAEIAHALQMSPTSASQMRRTLEREAARTRKNAKQAKAAGA